ncbi:MAG: hypothetical protein ACK4UY_03810 [Dietzia sp.]
MSIPLNRILITGASIGAYLEGLKNEILGGVGPAFDTLKELADAYEEADESLTALMENKADKTDPRFTDPRTPTEHQHPVTELTATGRTASNYLRGDNTWGTPTNTTYAILPVAEGESGTAVTARSITASVLRHLIDFRLTGSGSTPSTTIGKALMTAANAAGARLTIGAEPKGWDGTQADYDNLSSIDPDRSYYIVE